MTEHPSRPVLRTYRGADRAHVAMPVGGVGTGCISFGGRGQLVDWELFNRPAKGYAPQSFFATRVEVGEDVHTLALESALMDHELDGHLGSAAPMHGLPRFRNGEFDAAYPFGQVRLSDPVVPVDATVQAFNPLVPGDAEASGILAFFYRARIHNRAANTAIVSVCGSLQNVIGREQGKDLPSGNLTELRELPGATVLAGSSTQVAHDHEAWGTLALGVVGERPGSSRLTWAERSWGDSLLDFWDDFTVDGRLEEPEHGARVPTGSLVTTREIAPGSSADFVFVLAWHFPHRRAWSHTFHGPPRYGYGEEIVGNHYTEQYADATDVVRAVAPRICSLQSSTATYVETITTSDLPLDVQDAVLSNTAVLKSPTCFRIQDGTFAAWEGANPDHGSCHGSCTHVWNYQYALEQLFPDLAWSMRKVEFVHSLDERGLMSFRAGLPLESEGTGWRVAAADGQMGAIVRRHRTWLLTGRDDRLRALWPGVRRAMEFAWIPLGWDADRDGLMEGCQHNTMDVEYYGPNGVGQSWYLAGLAACAAMAEAMGDQEFATTCRAVLESGARLTDADLFNGEYYEQRVLPPGSADRIAEGLRIRYAGENPDVGSDDLTNPDLQIGPGCTSDQLVGHSMALLGGLDDGLNRQHTDAAARSIFRHNHRDEFYTHFNHLRSFALGAERGLLNGTYPRGGRPTRPFPYCHEVWTGLEYSAAIALALHGEHTLAERVVSDVRARHTGRARNPFNEVECGNHYVRSMASFWLAHAWARVVPNAAKRSITLDPVVGTWPVVAGDQLGHVEVSEGPEGLTAHHRVRAGHPWRVRLRPTAPHRSADETRGAEADE